MRAWDSTSRSSRFQPGEMSLGLHRLAGAFKAWKRAVVLDPDLAIAWFNLGEAYRGRRNRKALRAYHRALTLDPNSRAWLGQAESLSARRHFDETVASFDQALQLEGNLARAWHGKGIALQKCGRYDAVL